jgi:hypothetical protein
MFSLLMFENAIVTGNSFVVTVCIIMAILVLFSAAACWRGWGWDIASKN